MVSYQRLALFVIFDSLERDLVAVIRSVSQDEDILTQDEQKSAQVALSRQPQIVLDSNASFDQILGLDIGTKYQVLMRLKDRLDNSVAEYYRKLQLSFEKVVPVRNAVMHGRPLTIEEYAIGLAFSQDLLRRPKLWPNLQRDYIEYARAPDQFASKAVSMLDHPENFGVLNNLPLPDYDDTGFFPRPDIERSLKKKILGRHPVITVLGDGGNGKSAISLQTLYRLIESNDHGFDLILWYSAKVAALSVQGIKEIEAAVTSSSAIVAQAAEFEPGSDDPMVRLKRLLSQNKVLLVIDNLETVTGDLIKDLVEDIPGESKLLLTSRIPVGGDLPVAVNEFTESEAVKFLRIVINAHSVAALKAETNDKIKFYAGRLGYKPLLLKWFVLGVKSGLNPDKIVADPKEALRFCLENVIDRLSPPAQRVSVVLATVPEAVSASVIEEVARQDALHVDDGIGELSRFGLISAEDVDGVDRQYKLRSFVRSYIMRVINPNPSIVNFINEQYRKLSADYERERMQVKLSKYNIKHMTVRSKSEAIAAKKLKYITRTAYFDGYINEKALTDLKVSNPTYFEVYRSEAVAAYSAADVTRAIQSYEAALQYGADQPQLHYFFAGLLMRSGYNDRANEEYEEALKIDPDEPIVLREAARNLFMLHRYDQAKSYLDKAASFKARSQKDVVVLLDLQIQSRVRLVEYASAGGEFDVAVEGCRDLLDFLKSCDVRLFDNTMYGHIRAVNGAVAIIRRDDRRTHPGIDDLSAWIRENASLESQKHRNNRNHTKIGFLKTHGRKPTFGFIVDNDLNEYFVAAGTVDPEMWTWLTEDGAVSFDFEQTDKGPKAINIERFE